MELGCCLFFALGTQSPGETPDFWGKMKVLWVIIVTGNFSGALNPVVELPFYSINGMLKWPGLGLGFEITWNQVSLEMSNQR